MPAICFIMMYVCHVGGVITEGKAVAPAATLSEAVAWLEQEAHRIIRASKREMNDSTAAFPPQVGIHYEAFWLRDYEYTLEGSVDSYSDKELTDACRLFVQYGCEWRRGGLCEV